MKKNCKRRTAKLKQLNSGCTESTDEVSSALISKPKGGLRENIKALKKSNKHHSVLRSTNSLDNAPKISSGKETLNTETQVPFTEERLVQLIAPEKHERSSADYVGLGKRNGDFQNDALRIAPQNEIAHKKARVAFLDNNLAPLITRERPPRLSSILEPFLRDPDVGLKDILLKTGDKSLKVAESKSLYTDGVVREVDRGLPVDSSCSRKTRFVKKDFASNGNKSAAQNSSSQAELITDSPLIQAVDRNKKNSISPCRVTLTNENIARNPKNKLPSTNQKSSDSFEKIDSRRVGGPTRVLDEIHPEKRNLKVLDSKLPKINGKINATSRTNTRSETTTCRINSDLSPSEEESIPPYSRIKRELFQPSNSQNSSCLNTKPVKSFYSSARTPSPGNRAIKQQSQSNEENASGQSNARAMLLNRRKSSDSTDVAHRTLPKTQKVFETVKEKSARVDDMVPILSTTQCNVVADPLLSVSPCNVLIERISSISPCKVRLERLDIDFKSPNRVFKNRRTLFAPRENAYKRSFPVSFDKGRSFHPDSETSESDYDVCLSTDSDYSLLSASPDFKGRRLRTNPKQRDLFESKWEVGKKRKRRSDPMMKHRRTKKRRKKLVPKLDRYAKSLEYINKRFFNQNALNRLLLLEAIT